MCKKARSVYGKEMQGFTLIELLVVIAIIGILSSVVLASLNSARAGAREVKRAADMKAVITALERYNIDTGAYPPSNPNSHPACNSGWCLAAIVEQYLMPQYLSSVPSDPQHAGTGNNYRYCGNATNYSIIRRSENVSGWCAPAVPAPHTTCGGVGNEWYLRPQC